MIKMPEILVFWLTDFLTLSIQTLKVLYNYIINHINIYTNADIKKCQLSIVIVYKTMHHKDLTYF